MKIAGIVAEYNPFHTGHQYQIQQTRLALGEDTAVVAVMSGNWVQQANCAAADKWTRARLALIGGVDLVLELPTVWATASAEGFARGAVTLLHKTGMVTHLSFGSECGDAGALAQAARCLDSPEYQQALSPLLTQGMSFPAARQKAVEAVLEGAGAALASPNNNLGVEYIRALNALESSIVPMTVLRAGAAHNSISTDQPPFVSATQIRRDLALGDWDHALPYLLPGSRSLLETISLPSLPRLERAVLAKLRTMTVQDWAALPDSGAGEGLPLRLERAGRQCTSVSGFLEEVKTKRYTHARLRRLVLWAYLGLQEADIPATPPYLRVLAFNDRGRELLKQMKKTAALPILTKPAHARALSAQGRALFELEARFTDLYDLCLDPIPAPGREWTTSPVFISQEL